jgi:hypothetical protein
MEFLNDLVLERTYRPEERGKKDIEVAYKIMDTA